MYFDVSQLLKEPSGSRLALAIDDELALLKNGRVSRVTGAADMLRTDKGIWVTAELEAEVVCECVRCLDEYRQPVRMALEEEFLPQVDVTTGARLANPTSSDENFYIDHDHVLNLTEAVRQYCTLSLPMKPVCRKECPGICLTCGVNLNETACICDTASVDHRWDALLEMASSKDRDD